MNNSPSTESILHWLKIYSAKEITPLLINLTSAQYSEYGQKADSLFAKILQEWALA